MKRKILYPLTTFIVIFILHVTYSILKMIKTSQQWVQIENINFLSLYLKQQDFLLGYSYALAGAFTIYAFIKFQENRRNGLSGVVAGITLTGILYIGGCFLLGCCGSPLLVVYLSIFGSSFLGFTKPLVAIITTTSVLIGYFWIEKKSKRCCEGGQKICLEDEKS